MTAQTDTKGKREKVFRRFMDLCKFEDYTTERAIYAIAADLGVEPEDVIASLNRTTTGH
jgi:hypothetical protein